MADNMTVAEARDAQFIELGIGIINDSVSIFAEFEIAIFPKAPVGGFSRNSRQVLRLVRHPQFQRRQDAD